MGILTSGKNQNFTYFIVILGTFLFLRFISPILGPILPAFILVDFAYPFLCSIQKKFRIPKLIPVLLFFALVVAILCGVVFLAGSYLKDQAERLISMFEETLEWKELPWDRLNLMSFAKSGTEIAWYCFIFVLSTVLLLKDYPKIAEGIQNYQVSRRIYAGYTHVRNILFHYIKVQFVLFLLIGSICSLVFSFLKEKNGILLGLITGFLDMLPFVGTGIILVPKSIIGLLEQEYIQSLTCILLYVFCIIIRELLEPRLIGKRTGILPFAIFASIFIGIRVFGGFGVIKGPILLITGMELIQGKLLTDEDM